MREKRRHAFARVISAAHAQQLLAVSDSLTTAQSQKTELAQTREQVQASAAQKEKEKKTKERLLAKSEREAFGFRQRREQELDEIEEIQREALILGELIDRLASLPGVQDAIDYDFPGWQGRLHWPLTGNVKSTVGRKIDGKYQTETFETGVFIAGSPGSAVVNAADGEVAYAGRRRGLGNVVVVGHGQDYFSVFAHLGEIAVITGQVLRAGDPIGTAGESHPRYGAGVLFELRHHKDVLDPLEWLK
jgi:murein DD-endopeptidase MepM/ murein hydrolase activator NlpD